MIRKYNLLLVCSDESVMGVIRFMIETKGGQTTCGFKVWASPTEEIASGLISAKHYEFFAAALIVRTSMGDRSVAICNMISDRGIKSMLLDKGKPGLVDPTMNCHAYINSNVPVQDWMDRLRILCARKRGPKSVKSREISKGMWVSA